MMVLIIDMLGGSVSACHQVRADRSFSLASLSILYEDGRDRLLYVDVLYTLLTIRNRLLLA